MLEVDRKKYISGRCAYQIGPDGSFEFHGPHQIWSGIDYPTPPIFAGERSNDYFVQVDWSDDKELDDGSPGPGWVAHWNEDKRSTHAQSLLGSVMRHGACYSNVQTKICLWKK